VEEGRRGGGEEEEEHAFSQGGVLAGRIELPELFATCAYVHKYSST